MIDKQATEIEVEDPAIFYLNAIKLPNESCVSGAERQSLSIFTHNKTIVSKEGKSYETPPENAQK